jgi:hypothetical protein
MHVVFELCAHSLFCIAQGLSSNRRLLSLSTSRYVMSLGGSDRQ